MSELERLDAIVKAISANICEHSDILRTQSITTVVFKMSNDFIMEMASDLNALITDYKYLPQIEKKYKELWGEDYKKGNL